MVANGSNRGTTFLVGPFLGPAIAGYIGAGTDWRISFGVLTAIYGASTIGVVLFGRETYYTPHRPGPAPSRVALCFGIGNTQLPKRATLWYWCRMVVIYVFKFPLFMTGKPQSTVVGIWRLIYVQASRFWSHSLGRSVSQPPSTPSCTARLTSSTPSRHRPCALPV